MGQRGDGQEPISFEEVGGVHAAAERKAKGTSEGEESENSTFDNESQATVVHRPTYLVNDGDTNVGTPRSLIRHITKQVQLAESKDGADEAAAPATALSHRNREQEEMHESTPSLSTDSRTRSETKTKETKSRSLQPENDMDTPSRDPATLNAHGERLQPTTTISHIESAIARFCQIEPHSEDIVHRPLRSIDSYIHTEERNTRPLSHPTSLTNNTSISHNNISAINIPNTFLSPPPPLEHGTPNNLDENKETPDINEHLARLADTASIDDSDTQSVTSAASDTHSEYVRRGRSYRSPENRNSSTQLKGFYSVPPLSRDHGINSLIRSGRSDTERVPRKRTPSRRFGYPHGERITEEEQYSSEKKRIAFFKQETRHLVMSDVQKRNFYMSIGHLPDADFCRHVQRLQEMHKRAQPPDPLSHSIHYMSPHTTNSQQNNLFQALTQIPVTPHNALTSNTPNGIVMSNSDLNRSNSMTKVVPAARSNDIIFSENAPNWEQKYREEVTFAPTPPITPKIKQEPRDVHIRDETDDASEQSSDSTPASRVPKLPVEEAKAAYQTRSATRNRERKAEKNVTVVSEGKGSREKGKNSPGQRDKHSQSSPDKKEKETKKYLPTPYRGGKEEKHSSRGDPPNPESGDGGSTEADSNSDSSSVSSRSQRNGRSQRPVTHNEKQQKKKKKPEIKGRKSSSKSGHGNSSHSDHALSERDLRSRQRKRRKGRPGIDSSDSPSSSESDVSSRSSDDSSVQDITHERKGRDRNQKDKVNGTSRLTSRPMKGITGFRQTFSGSSGEDLLSFLSNFNRYFVLQGNKPGDENLGHLLALTLRGEAATTIAHMSGYEAMVERLKEAYVAATAALVQILTHMKMYKDETVASWTQRYRAQYYKCTAAGHTFGPKDELNFWIKGLIPEYKTPIITQSHRSLTRAINAATALETALKHSDDNPSTLSAYVGSGEVRINAQFGSDRGCYNCTQKGHISTECINPPFCPYCNKVGHNYRDCNRKSDTEQSDTSKNGSGRLANLTCNSCQQKGHLAKTCPNKGGKKGSKRNNNNNNNNNGDSRSVCAYCHKRGHTEDVCRKKARDLGKNKPKVGSTSSNDTCTECSGLLSKGHYATCSKAKAQNIPHRGAGGSGLTYSLTLGSQGGQRQFLITLRISGEPFAAIVDPGAELSIVRRSVWKRFATPTLDSRYKLISLCRMTLPVIGMTSLNLSFYEGGRELPFRALMTIVPDYIFYPGAHMLLGLDVLRPLRMNMDIDEARDVLILKDSDRNTFRVPLWQQKGIRDLNTATAAAIHMVETTQGVKKAREVVHEILSRGSDLLELPGIPDNYVGTCEQSAPLAELSPSFVPTFPWTQASDREDEIDEKIIEKCIFNPKSHAHLSDDEVKKQFSLTHTSYPILYGNTPPFSTNMFTNNNGQSAMRSKATESHGERPSFVTTHTHRMPRYKGKIVPHSILESNPFLVNSGEFHPHGKDERAGTRAKGVSKTSLSFPPVLSQNLVDSKILNPTHTSVSLIHSVTTASSPVLAAHLGTQDLSDSAQRTTALSDAGSLSSTTVPVASMITEKSEASGNATNIQGSRASGESSLASTITPLELAQLWEARADPNRYPTFASTTTPTDGKGLLREL